MSSQSFSFLKPVICLGLNLAWKGRAYSIRCTISQNWKDTPHIPEPGSTSELHNAERLEQSRVLKFWLQKFPYWFKGHELYAVCTLELGQIKQAYASAQALIKLASTQNQLRIANLLLGRTYNKALQAKEAITVLGPLAQSWPDSSEVKEELAAAYLLLENFNQAQEILNLIPDAKLTAQAKSALIYLKNRAKEINT